MPWFDKALKSVQTTAEKTAFEADKMVRTKREEGVLSDAQKRVQAKLAELGQAALALYRSGMLSDPSVTALADEIVSLEAQVQQQREKLEAIHNEQYQPAGQPAAAEPEVAAPAAAAAPESAAPAVASAADVSTVAATIECPNCHAEVKSTVTFCPECGSRLK
jgi:capsule polysaccharide export protein KpsE/RkpR